MRRHIQLCLITAMVAGMAGISHADQDGTSTAQFLKISQGARAEGMGGAFTSVANDARAVNWNPAGLAQITRREMAFDHLNFIEDINAHSAAGVLPFNNLHGSLGVGVTYVDFGTIDRLDSGGAPVAGDNDITAMSGVVSWGQAIGDRLALGAGLKYLNQKLAGDSGSALAVDVGGLFFLIPDRLSIGASALNVGQKLKTGTKKEDIPLTFRGGLAYYIQPEWILSADGVKENDSDAKLHLGSEYVYRKAFIVRAGYQDTQESKGGLSAGAGFIWRPHAETPEFLGSTANRFQDRGLEIRFDYAYVDYGDFDATHRIGINIAY